MFSRLFYVAMLLAFLIRPSVLEVSNKALGLTSSQYGVSERTEQSMTVATLMSLLTYPGGIYRPIEMNDALVSNVAKSYIDSLDSNRIILLEEDLKFLQSPSMLTQLKNLMLSSKSSYLKESSDLFLERSKSYDEVYRSVVEDENFDFTGNDVLALRTKESAAPKDNSERIELIKASVKDQWLSLKLAGKDSPEIRKILLKRQDDFEKSKSRFFGKPDSFFNLMMASIAGTVDPHTTYIPPVAETNFNMSMALALEGIGATLQQDNAGLIVIRELIPGGPAFGSGKINVGDKIVGVAQDKADFVDVQGWSTDDVVNLVRGPAKSKVRLKLQRGQVDREVSLVREKIRMEEQAAKSKILDVDGKKVGIIRLNTFYQDFEAVAQGKADANSATKDVRRLLIELKKKGVQAVVMDLRGNGGGSLVEAVDLTGLFIDVGPVVQIRSTQSIEVEGDSNAGATWEGPMAVLVDRGSASASEIFAAAIQDLGRGLIVGENTFGKGTVQTVLNLKDIAKHLNYGGVPPGGVLKFTTAQFYRVSGETTQKYGVSPDIAFPVSFSGRKLGEDQYPNALEPDSIVSTLPKNVQQLSSVPGLIEILTEKHEVRAKQEPELVWMAEDKKEYDQLLETKELSLNEEVRRADLERLQDKKKSRIQARKEMGLPTLDFEAYDGLEEYERPMEEQLRREAEIKKMADSVVDAPVRESAKILVDAMKSNMNLLVL